jgi:hypothetical protein
MYEIEERPFGLMSIHMAAVESSSAAERIGLVTELERATARRAAMDVAMAALETRDRNTALHCDDVLTLCDAMGRRLGFDDRCREQLAAGALLHDVGKVGIPPEVLNKPGALTDAEWTMIREHTVIGERIVRAVPALAEVAPIVRHSHEHWDGSGYPDGLSGDAIPLASRVILCADAFHAMRSDRPYRHGRNALSALAEIEACADSQFDPTIVDTFVAVAEDARNGGGVACDRLRKRRLIALLTALAIGTGGAFAAIPQVREAIKSLFATSVPPSHAASDTAPPTSDIVPPRDLRVGPLGETVRLPSPERHAKPQQQDAQTKAAKPRTNEASRPATKDAERAGPTPSDVRGRALGRGEPVPRMPAQSPTQTGGGRTDPPAFGLHAGPSGAAQQSRSARERSATR